jgi:hypothetical protein
MKKFIKVVKKKPHNQKIKLNQRKIGVQSYSILEMMEEAPIPTKIRKNGKICQKKKGKKE